MFSMYIDTIEGEESIVLQHGEGEHQLRLAFDRAWAGRVAMGMLQFALGLMPETTNNEEDTTNG